jgi:hypothetical protein
MQFPFELPPKLVPQCDVLDAAVYAGFRRSSATEIALTAWIVAERQTIRVVWRGKVVVVMAG